MNNSLSAVCDFVNRHSYPILLTLFVLWMCIGIFPLICYEADGMWITMGCDIMYNEGWSFPPIYSYEYRMQPLITILIVALKHLMPFFTCEQIYCALTALFSLAFLLGCISFGRYITGLSKTRVLIAAILLPEMYAIAMYANSAIPAAACFIWALMLTTKGKHWQSVVLLSVAAWFRIDIVMVYPVIFPLLGFKGITFKRSFWMAVAYGVAIVVLSLAGYWIMHAEVFGTVNNLNRWNDIITPILRFYAIYGFYSLAYFILLPLGVFVIATDKRWLELFVVLLPIVLVHVVLAEFGNAAKHFLYNAPFVIIAGTRALSWLGELLKKRPVLKWSVLGLVMVFFTMSVRRKQLDIMWIQGNPLHNAGTVLPLGSVNIGGSDLALSIGAGPQVITRDEYMLGSGNLFYSWYIHDIKDIMTKWRAEQKEVLDQSALTNILALEVSTSPPIATAYLEGGCHFLKQDNMAEKYEYTICNSKHHINFWRVYLTEAEHSNAKVLSYIDSLDQVFPKGDNYVISSLEHFGTERFLDEIAKTGRIEKKATRIYLIGDKKE
jgi:hypothetical protein